MSLQQTYLDLVNIRFTKRDLQEYLKMCSSFDNKGNIHPRVILTPNGRPIPADDYQKVIGARELVKPLDFSKTMSEAKTLRLHKQSYKAGMRALYGNNWKNKSRKLGYNNVPSNKEDYNEVAQEVANLKLS